MCFQTGLSSIISDRINCVFLTDLHFVIGLNNPFKSETFFVDCLQRMN